MTNIIGFTGKMGTGKTTACDYLIATKPEFKKINFKDALRKEMIERLPDTLARVVDVMNTIEWDGMKPWDIDRLFNEKPPLFRALMQNYGTEVRRGDDQEYWIKKWKESVGGNYCVVADDVRFLNEAQAIRDVGGKIVRLQRADITDTGVHASESEMDQIVADVTITAAQGDFETLHNELSKLIT